MESITLYFREGSSDKVYQASIEPEGSKFVVNIAYGRRGATLQIGSKTAVAVEYDAARIIWEKVVKEKKAKGYTEGENGSPYSGGDGRDTGIRPQLLNPVEERELSWLLADNDFLLQPKMDGKRLLIRKQGREVTGINRKGLACGISESLRKAALALPGDYLVDGEAIGDVLHVFDLLENYTQDLRGDTYHYRQTALLNQLAEGSADAFLWVPCYRGVKQKRAAFDRLRQSGAEGVVFKRADAPWDPGRPASGGNQLKFKFVDTASCVVGKPCMGSLMGWPA